MDTVKVRLNNQDGTPAGYENDLPISKIAGACLITFKGNNYTYSHFAGDCVVFTRAGHILAL